jgi:hypothetical protein
MGRVSCDGVGASGGEELPELLGRLRSAVIGWHTPQLLRLAMGGRKAALSAAESLNVVLRMLTWQTGHSQVALDALLAAWAPGVHYLNGGELNNSDQTK